MGRASVPKSSLVRFFSYFGDNRTMTGCDVYFIFGNWNRNCMQPVGSGRTCGCVQLQPVFDEPVVNWWKTSHNWSYVVYYYSLDSDMNAMLCYVSHFQRV